MAGKDDILSAIADLPDTLIRDALAATLAAKSDNEETQSAPGAPSADTAERDLRRESIGDLYSLFAYAKRTYPFPELGKFELEAGTVYYLDGPRRLKVCELTKPSPPPTRAEKPQDKDSGRFHHLELEE